MIRERDREQHFELRAHLEIIDGDHLTIGRAPKLIEPPQRFIDPLIESLAALANLRAHALLENTHHDKADCETKQEN